MRAKLTNLYQPMTADLRPTPPRNSLLHANASIHPQPTFSPAPFLTPLFTLDRGQTRKPPMRKPNTTFDIYLGGALPPAAPDVEGATGHLSDHFAKGQKSTEGQRVRN